MKTFEGTFIIKWFKNDSYGDRRPLTIDCESNTELKQILNKLKSDFMNEGENNKLPYSLSFDLNERK